MVTELRGRLTVVSVRLEPIECVVGDQTITDSPFAMRHKIVNPWNLLVERARSNNAEGPRYLDAVVDPVVCSVRNPKSIKTSRCWFRLPHALDGGEFHLLIFRYGVATLVPENDHA